MGESRSPACFLWLRLLHCLRQPEKPDDGISLQGDIPLKLHRAMQTPAPSGSNVLRERNADRSDETILSRDAGVAAPEVLVLQARKSDEKENHLETIFFPIGDQ